MATLRTRADGSTIKPMKHTSPAPRDPNSKRSKRRQARASMVPMVHPSKKRAHAKIDPFVSRCNRRASQRLASQSTNPSLQASKPGFHEPGALKKW